MEISFQDFKQLQYTTQSKFNADVMLLTTSALQGAKGLSSWNFGRPA